MSNFKKVFYGIMSILGLVVFLISMAPVFSGIINIGVIVPAVCSMLITIYSLLSLKYPMENIPWKKEMTPEYENKIKEAIERSSKQETKFRKTLIMGIGNKNLDNYESGIENYVPGMIMSREKRTIIDRIVWILVAFAIVVTGAAFSIMKNGYEKYDGNYKGQTILVLGAKINGSKPSRSLKYRLDKALEILKENEQAKCIVSGGKGSDELFTEAQVMKAYLVDKGIDRHRIFEEKEAKNTKENLLMSKKLANELGLENKFILVTQEYHLFRASKYAKEFGINSLGAIAKTPKSTVIPYWIREIIGMILQM